MNKLIDKLIHKRAGKAVRIISSILTVALLLGLLPTFLARADSYTLTLSANAESVSVGDKYTISLTLNTSYTSADAKLTYDPALAEYSGISGADTGNLLVSESEHAPGTLLVSRYGGTRNADVPVAALLFKAKVAGEAEFALIDDSSFSPEITINFTQTSDDVDIGGAITVTSELESADLEISTAAELAAFRDAVNGGEDFAGKTVRLAADIDLSAYPDWISIGQNIKYTLQYPKESPKYNAFRGVFDGAGHTVTLGIDKEITDSYYYGTFDENEGDVSNPHGNYVGLFGRTENAEIKNLNTDGFIKINEIASIGNISKIGAVAAQPAESTIRNCMNYADITLTNGSVGTLGGVVGEMTLVTSAYSQSNLLTSCANYGRIEIPAGFSDLGGVAGSVFGSVIDCMNAGEISRPGSLRSGTYTGGVAGYTQGDSQSIVSGCYNIGDVSSTSIHIAGITNSTGVNISNCYNTGNLSTARASTAGDQLYICGITASSSKIQVANCYNTGTFVTLGGTSSFGTEIALSSNYSGTDTLPTITNCYGKADAFTAADLGDAFKPDANNINGGYPLLAWQSDTAPADAHRVTFNVAMPEGASTAPTVALYSDAARKNVIPAESDGSFSLTMGSYFYSVAAEGCVTETGSVNVLYTWRNVAVTLRTAATVTLNITPATATLTLRDTTGTVTPTSRSGGAYTYTLYAGDVYSYTATALNYNSALREFAAADDTINVALTPSEQPDKGTIRAGQTISEGGSYRAIRQSGTITISTTEPVTLIGYGLAAADVYQNLYINCTVPGVDLTLQDVYISNSAGGSNMINFTGAGNTLRFGGVNVLDQNTGTDSHSMIHVPPSASLTVIGNVGGELYIYKRGQAAAIGGDSGEYNGEITFAGGKIFAKNSMQGALIGSGTNATNGAPGDIKIVGGELNLIAVSRSAAIGGAAGSGGGAGGSNVYVYPEASVNINVDWSGAAIGGGGYGGGNDSDGGTFHYLGGSVRVFIDYNAVDQNGDGSTADTLWPGIEEPGANDAAITADKVDGDGSPVRLFVFDTARLNSGDSAFTVYKDGDAAPIYSGGLHRYSFINEDRHKDSQVNINYTIDNWVPLADTNLYLYLTPEDHALTVNGIAYSVSWNAEEKIFTLFDGTRNSITVSPDITGGTLALNRETAAAGEPVTVTLHPDPGNRYKADSLKLDGVALTQANGVATFAMPAYAVTLTAQFEEIPDTTPRYGVTIDSGSGGAVTTDKAQYAEGEPVIVTVAPAPGSELVAGSLAANGSAIAAATDGVYSFLMPDGEVTITAQFAKIEVTAPNGTKMKAGAAQDLVLRIAKASEMYDAAHGLTLNGTALPKDTYTVTGGGTTVAVVTVDAAYLNTLGPDSYTLTVPFTDGTSVTLDFTIAANPLFDISTDPAISNGALTPDPASATAEETVTVAVAPIAGYRLVPGSLKYDGRTINAANGAYTFEMPAWDVTLTAQFIEVAGSGGGQTSGNVSATVWDGKSLDLTWFDPSANAYHISTPAQLAGLAALVNGLYNAEIDTVAGNASYIRVNTGLGDEDGPQGNNKSTATYHYGDYNFAGKTVYLEADINMGSANYMPIGGQYLMVPNDATTRIDASFNGVFDGQGHTVTINADRHVSTGNFGDGSSVGLIGRLGVHDNDPISMRASGLAVRNVAVRGSVHANRSVGGIVGKIGKNNGGAIIENCANFADVSSTDAKGVGGIVGAAWNGGEIRNCYNAGNVSGTHTNPAGGIAGSAEIAIINSYNVGTITAPSGYAMGIGTNNGGAPLPENSYYLDSSASDGGWYTGGAADNTGVKTAAYMKLDEFVSLLGDAFVKDTRNINNGYPVLAWQGGAPVAPSSPDTATTVVDAPVALSEDPTLVVINVDTGGAAVSSITAEVTAENVKAIADNGSSIEVRSDLGSVRLPNAAITDLAGKADEKIDVKLTKDSADTYTLALTADDKPVATVTGGIKLTLPAENANSGTVAVLVRQDGTEDVIKKSFIKDGKLNIPLDGSATVKLVDNAKAFADVGSGSWYNDSVRFASSHELFTGTGADKFSPEASMTRGMLVTVLYRLENEPPATGDLFADVASDAYYANAVLWAAANDIVFGTGAGKFSPDTEITREQLATMLHRYHQFSILNSQFSIDTSSDVSVFPDADDVSDWAEDAMRWAVSIGLIQGRDGALAPQGTATRAEVATVLRRFIEQL
jgi:hypothetical protein